MYVAKKMNITYTCIVSNPEFEISAKNEPLKYDEFTPTVRELYIQTQHWTRHNENLIVATNALMFSAIGAVAVALFKNPETLKNLVIIMAVISLIGMVLTYILNRRYMFSVERLVMYEKLFGFHKKESAIDNIGSKPLNWGSCFIPKYLQDAPKFAPESAIFFLILHVLLLIACAWFYF